MADLTQNIPLTADWVNVTSAASLAAGTKYVMDIPGVHAVTVEWAMTDDATAPTVKGHHWDRQAQLAEHEQKSGENLWMRVVNGQNTVLAVDRV